MQTGNVTGQIEEVRRQALAVLQDLATKAGIFGLPEPPETLQLYQRKLQDNEYRVLVVGEAKRGKSTLVNALIGQDILPTDVDVATSQIFKISPSAREDYRLRFEDGSEQHISREDLPLYGSQVMADAGRSPTLAQIIRWIEVDVPVRFLPEGVSMLDTPGLGALYASHAQITHRFVPEADAVIFVLDSGQPVVEEDLNFIEEILGVTRNIFFVQTKIDLFDKDHWQAIQRRSQEILMQRFEGRLVDPRVWPLSSTNLRKAASWDGKTAEAYLMVSRHKDVEAALRAFLARVAGWSRAAEAMLAVAQYHSTCRKALSGRLGSVESSDQKRAELQKAATRHKQQFEADWGLKGRKLRGLREEIQKSTFVGKQSFAKYIAPGGDIEVAQIEKIVGINSLDEANKLASEMPEEVMSGALKKWSSVCRGVQDRCVELLGPLAEAADKVSTPVGPNMEGFASVDSGPGEGFKHDYFMMLRGGLGGGMLLTSVASTVNLLLPAGLMAALAGPAVLVAAPALIVLTGVGIKSARKGEINNAQQELRGRLREILLRLQRHFFDVDQASGRLSLVDEYFKTLERTMNERIGDLVRQKSAEAKAEIDRLTQAAKLDDQQREAQSRRIREQLAEWDEIGKRTKNIMTRIKALKEGGAAPVPQGTAAGKG
jgi:GTPase SAR1 family protein